MKLKRITSPIHSSGYHERGSFILKGQIRQLLLSPLFPPCVLQTEHRTESCTCAGSLPSIRSEPFSTGSTSRTYPKHTPTPSPATLPAQPAAGSTAHGGAATFQLPLRPSGSPWRAGATEHARQHTEMNDCGVRGLVRTPPRKPAVCTRVKH